VSELDVIVVGAGPAGGSCARELARRGRTVLVLERSPGVGEPDFSTGATPDETLEAFSLPESVADAAWSSALFASRRARSELLADRRLGWVLSYQRVTRHLAAEAEAEGAEIRTGAAVMAPVLEGASVCGVRYRRRGAEQEARARVVVDASGGRGLLSQRLGLVRAGRRALALALEVHMDGVALEREGRLDFYLGPGFVPEGYAWIFPMGPGRAKVGIATFAGRSQVKHLRPLLTRFVRENPQTANARVVDVHGGATFACGGIRSHARDGFLVIGDAAGQVNPLAGEGIRHALFSGRFAAEVIDAALEAERIGRSALEPYDLRWRRYVGKAWRHAFWLQRLARRVTRYEGACDRLVGAIGRLGAEEVHRICFGYDFSLLRPGIPTLGRVLLATLPRLLGARGAA
jgi:geranylgeranyl reductase family protein